MTGDLGQGLTEATSMFVNMTQFEQCKKVKLGQIQRIDDDAVGAKGFIQLLSEATSRSSCFNLHSG
jgi:hypothetical protein